MTATPSEVTRYSLNLAAPDASSLLALTRAAEDAGFERVWAQDGERSAYATTAWLAGQAAHIGLGTGVAHAFTSTALATAGIARTLHEVTAGRFVLGLGTASRSLIEQSHGLAFDHPAARMRERVRVIRGLLDALDAGCGFTYAGEFERVAVEARHTATTRRVGQPPIYLGAQGRVMARIAGEVADGMLGSVLGTRDWLASQLVPAIRRGLRSAGRDDRGFTLVGTMICAISDDEATARRHVLQVLAHYARADEQNALSWHGFERDADCLRRLPFAEAERHISADLIDCFAAAGRADYVRKRVSALAGVVHAIRLLPPPYVLGAEEITAYQEAILHTFGKS